MISLWNLSRSDGEPMISFKGAHVAKDIISPCVWWYVAYPLSYRQLCEWVGVEHRTDVGEAVSTLNLCMTA
jgi:hypothetical protein